MGEPGEKSTLDYSNGNFDIEVADAPEIAFRSLLEFLGHLRKKYPENMYYSDESLYMFNPSARIGGNKTENKSLLAFKAQKDQVPAGLIFGTQDQPETFKIEWFGVDPEFQNSGLAEKLMDIVKSRYNKVKLDSSAFGFNKAIPTAKVINRNKALARYYERFGFVPDTSDKWSKIYPEGYPFLPMVWEKKD